MYDKTKLVFKEKIDVNELCNILSNLPARAEICICGDSNCYIHVEQDGSVVNLDNEPLDECYEKTVKNTDQFKFKIPDGP